MRVIAGMARGRTLRSPQGMATRPTPDRVREALFSILVAHVQGARVLDLFAGTGALAIEAMSRGAASAVLVEQDAGVAKVIRQNLAVLGERQSACRLLCQPVTQALALLGREHAPPFDLVLLDPPYALNLLPTTLAALDRSLLVAPDTVVVAEHAGREAAPTAPATWGEPDTRRYGDVALSIWTLQPEQG